MQCDEVIWNTISVNFCSYKLKTTTQAFCRNEYNVTGLCSKQACPLANSRYATIKHDQITGTMHLYVKTIERAHSPKNMWEKIKLSKNYVKALEQIDKELIYFPKFLIHKCKQRLTKMTQYIIRMRRLKLKAQPKLIAVKKKLDRREAKREEKAQSAAKLTKSIESELLERLRSGVYGADGIVNESSQAFARALDQIEELDDGAMLDEEEEEVEEEEEEDDLLDREFVSDISDSEGEDIEDFNAEEEEGDDDDDDENDDEAGEESEGSMSSDSDQEMSLSDDDDSIISAKKKTASKKVKANSSSKFSKKRGARVNVEYEQELELPSSISQTQW